MAIDAGSVFVKLGGLFVRDEFDKWDRAVDSERAKAKDPINAKLGADSSKLASDLAGARGQLNSYASQKYDATVGVDERSFGLGLARIAHMLAQFITSASAQKVTVPVDLNLTEAEAKLALLRAEIAALGGGDVRLGGAVGGVPVLPSGGGPRLLPAAGGTSGGQSGLWGVRGPYRAGSMENPLVTVGEAGRLTPLGGRSAAYGYAPETGSSGGGAQPLLTPGQPVTGDRERGAPSWFSMPNLGENVGIQIDEAALQRSLSATSAQLDAWAAANDETVSIDLDTANALARVAILSKAIDALQANAAEPLALPPGAMHQYGEAGYQPNFVFSRGPGVDPFTGRFRQMPPGFGSRGAPILPPDPFAEGYGSGAASRGIYSPFSTREDPFAMFPMPGDGGGGGGGGGGGFGGRFGGGAGNWLFGAGNRFGRGGPINPFRFGIHGPLGAVGGALGLGPEHLLGAALSVAGSGVGALGGAGVMALGGAGVTAVGAGSDAAIIKSTIADTQQLYKQLQTNTQNITTAQQNYNFAVATYGKNSSQARTALADLVKTQAQAKAQMADLQKQLGPGAAAELQLAKQVQNLNTMWDQMSGNARKQAVKILEQVVGLGRSYVGRVIAAAEQNLSIINKNIRPLFTWLEGPQGIQIWNKLEDTFKAHLPTAVHALVQTIEALLRTVSVASEFSGHLVDTWDKLATRWNTMPTEELRAKMGHLVDDFRIWENLIKYVAKDLYDLFKAGSGEGNDLIISLTNILKKWNEWETSTRGQDFLHTFFENRKQELYAIANILGAVISMFGQFYKALQPLVPAVTAFARSIAEALGFLGNSILKPIAEVLGTMLMGFNHLTQMMGPFKELVLVPLGLFLLSWRRFGLESTVGVIKAITNVEKLGRVVTAVKEALLGVGSLGAVWSRIKDIFSGNTPKDGPGKMLASIVDGCKQGAALLKESIESALGRGGKEAAAEQETAIKKGGAASASDQEAAITKGGSKSAAEQEGAIAKGGAKAGAEEESGTAAGGRIAGAEEEAGTAAGGKIAGIEEGAGTAAGGAGAAVEGAAGGAVGGTLLSRVLRRVGIGSAAEGEGVGLLSTAGAAASRAVPILGAGLLLSQATGIHPGAGQGFFQNIAGGAIAGGTAGGVAGLAGGGISAIPGSILGAIGGGLGGLFVSLFGGGGPSKEDVNKLKNFANTIKDLKNPAEQSAVRLQRLRNEAISLGNTFSDGKIHKGLVQIKAELDKAIPDSKAWGQAVKAVQNQLSHWYIDTGRTLNALKDDYNTHLTYIANKLGLSTKQGKEYAEKNMQDMVRALQKSMDDGTISVNKGMKELNRVLDNGLSQGYSDWKTTWTDTFETLNKLQAHNQITSRQWLDQASTMYQRANKQVHDQTISIYQSMFDKLAAQRHQGLISEQQYNADKKSLENQRNADTSTSLAAWVNMEMNAMKASGNWTHAGMTEVANQVNDALQLFGQAKLKTPEAINWAKWVSAGHTGGSTVGGVGGIGGHGPGGFHAASGGMLPGAEFGYEDNMTLVDPVGRPVAKMAGDEAVFNRHQMPYVEAGLQMLGFNGAEDLWHKVNRPHGYERGGRLQKYAKGGFTGPANTYVSPFGAVQVTWGRTDQGVDVNLPIGSPIGAIGNARVAGVLPGWYKGQPLIYYQLLDGPDKGQYVYDAEQISGVPGTSAFDPVATSSLQRMVGRHLAKGQAIGYYATAGTGLETGWATASGETLARATTGYKEGQATPAGASFEALIRQGKIVPITGGPSIPTIVDPTVRGTGTLTNVVQHGLDTTVTAANKYLQNRLSSLAGGAGGQAAQALPGGWYRVGATIDPTMGQAPTYDAHGGFSFAELLVAGNNANFRNSDLAATMGIPNGTYGMPMETPLWARMPGMSRMYKMWKNDVGSGQAGNPFFKVDLHQAIANAIGWTPNQAIEVKRAARGGKLNYSGGTGLPSLLSKPKGGRSIISIINRGSKLPVAAVNAAKEAVKKQINNQASRWWHIPKIDFGEHGDHTVTLFPGDAPGGVGGYNYGNSAAVGTGTPENGFMLHGQGGRHGPWSAVFSHEILEMLAGKQIADAVEHNTYSIDGVKVSDFVTDNWFKEGSPGPYDYMGIIHKPFGVAAGGYSRYASHNYMASGGRLRRLARGGFTGLYKPTRPRKVTHHQVHTQSAAQFPASVLRDFPELGSLLTPFAGDDAALAKLQSTYSRDQTVFGIYNPSGYTAYDLNTLYGLDKKQWNILHKEFDKLPHVLDVLYNRLHGYRPHQGEITSGTVSGIVGEPGSGGRGYPLPGGRNRGARSGGIDPKVERFEDEIASSEHEIWKLNKRLFNDEKAAATERHKVTIAATNAAIKLATQLGQLLDEHTNTLSRANAISRQIGALEKTKVSTNTSSTQAYNNAVATNQAIDTEISGLRAKRDIILGNAGKIYGNIHKVYQQHDLQLAKMRKQGYAIAWKYEMDRLNIGEKVKKIEHHIAELKKHLATEKSKQTQWQKAYDIVHGRLYGGSAIDPGAVSVREQLADVGLDVLSLAQQGASVPKSFIHEIDRILASLGVHIPPGVTQGAGATDAAAALQDFLNFQAARSTLFQSFGSNFVGAGANPFGTPAGIAAGFQFYGATTGATSGAPGTTLDHAGGGYLPGHMSGSGMERGGDTNINIEQNFNGVPDPHTQSAGLRHEIGAMF